MAIQTNDQVAFNQAVIKRCGYNHDMASKRGVVRQVHTGGKLADVDFGVEHKTVPLANLSKVRRDGAVLDI